MIVKYTGVIEYEIIYKVNESENSYLKSDEEMVESIGQMICDEYTTADSVASFNVLKSGIETC